MFLVLILKENLGAFIKKNICLRVKKKLILRFTIVKSKKTTVKNNGKKQANCLHLMP